MRRRFPRTLVVVWLLVASGLTYLWVVDPFGDAGMRNAFSTMAVVLGGSCTWVWFVLRSQAPRALRRAVLWVPLVGGALFLCLVEVTDFSGAMMPRFAYRWRTKGPALPAPSAGAPTLTEDAPRPAFPGFLGPERDGIVRGVRLARDWAARPPELLWRQPVGAGWGGMALADGRAFSLEERQDREVVVAYDLANGAVLWSHVFGAGFDHPLGGRGPRSTPSVAGGAVVVLGVHGTLACLEAQTGAPRWSHDLLAEYGVDAEHEAAHVAYGRANSPLLDGERVVVPVGGVAGARQAGLAAFDLATGTLLWEGPPRAVSFSSPVRTTLAGVDQLLIVNEDTASGHDPDTGALLWEHPWPGRTPNDANCSQARPVAPDRVLLSKGYGQGSTLLRLVPDDDGLAVEEVWRSRRALRTKFTNAVHRDGHAYALSDGILECVSLADGRRLWRDGRYGHGQLLLVGDLLLVLGESGELALVEARPEVENKVLGSLQALEGRTWNQLALAGDLLVLRNGDEAAAYRLALE